MEQPKIQRISELSFEWRALVAAAQEARGYAHAPYSQFTVGAALRTRSGRIFEGCNVENSSYGLTICAERVAVFKAVSEGDTDFTQLVIVTEPGGMPCGACRQVLNEFVADLDVLIADTSGHVWLTTLSALLPHSFPREDIAGLLAPNHG
jgi:cytidine deaminase